jgi:NADH:ubiquinone oxidoreductase subunit E
MTDPEVTLAPGRSTDMPTLAKRVTLPETQRSRLHQILVDRGQQPGALLPVLHAVQDTFGCIPPDAVADIADALNISRAEVHGVITFYVHFRSTPTGRHHIQICRAESCQAMGAFALLEHASQRLSCQSGSSSVNGSYTLEPVYCLGLCAQSPAVMIDGQPYARVDVERFDDLVSALEDQP